MFLNSDENTTAIKNLLSSASSIRCAVAFLGEKSFGIFKGSSSNVQIICNLDSGATNPNAVKKLMKLKNITVRNQPLLHAKVYLCDDEAIVSSANISANGLSLEDDEVAGWLEAGYKVNEPEQISKIGAWLSEQWDSAKEIKASDIAKAEIKWKARRKSRPAKPKRSSILDELRENPDFFNEKKVYFTITREERSDEAENLLENLRVTDGSKNELDAYEDWAALPGDSYFIDIYYGPKSEFEVMGLFYANGKTVVNRDGVSLFLCHEVPSIYELNLSNKDKLFLEKNISLLKINKKKATLLPVKKAGKQLFG